MYVERRLTYLRDSFDNKNELFDFMSDQLETFHYVTSDYRMAIKEREARYPTGLSLDGLNIAIAHTDSKYSLDNKIIGIKMKEPINFVNAENGNELPVTFIIGLIFVSGDKHLGILKKIASFFQDKQIINGLNQAATSDEIYIILDKLFNEEEPK